MKYTSENKPPDAILVDKILRGDTNAFATVIANSERLVAQIVFKMIADEEDRRDLAQDIYLKAFQKLGSFKFQSKLSTWIGQIAYNTCINHLEKKRLLLIENFYTNNGTDEEQLQGLNMDNEAMHNDTESLFFKNELTQILKKETGKLPPLYNTLITLFHTEELSYAEIKQITQLPEGTIKNYLFRARKILRTNLLKNYKKEEL